MWSLCCVVVSPTKQVSLSDDTKRQGHKVPRQELRFTTGHRSSTVNTLRHRHASDEGGKASTANPSHTAAGAVTFECACRDGTIPPKVIAVVNVH